MGGVPNAPGPSPTLESLGPSHQWRHKSRASLRGPPCAHGVAGTPKGEVRDNDFLYCKVMTIAVCDMQSKDCTAQVLLWRNLNSVVQRHGVDDIQFKGFMANSAQANWNTVQIVYGGGDPTVPMEERKRTCLFHWTQSLEKHTKANIRGDLQEQHRQLCKQYRIVSSMEDAKLCYFAINAWWLSSGATTTEGLQRLELWLSFWHFR